MNDVILIRTNHNCIRMNESIEMLSANQIASATVCVTLLKTANTNISYILYWTLFNSYKRKLMLVYFPKNKVRYFVERLSLPSNKKLSLPNTHKIIDLVSLCMSRELRQSSKSKSKSRYAASCCVSCLCWFSSFLRSFLSLLLLKFSQIINFVIF